MNTDLNIFVGIWIFVWLCIFVWIMCGRRKMNWRKAVTWNIHWNLEFSKLRLEPRIVKSLSLLVSVSIYQTTRPLSHFDTIYINSQKCAYNQPKISNLNHFTFVFFSFKWFIIKRLMNEIVSTKQERKIDREMWNFEVSHTLMVYEKKKERKNYF
jgi:hypothetical protein